MLIPVRVSGKAKIPEAELWKKLGRKAAQVLRMLWERRDKDTGELFVSDEGLQHLRGWEKLPRTVVKKALDRLRKAKLLVSVGKRWHTFPDGRYRVNVRRVRGQLVADRYVLVPDETATWCTTAAGWGGVRVSKRDPSWIPLAPLAPPEQEGSKLDPSWGARGVQLASESGSKRGPHSDPDQKICSSELSFSLRSKETRAGAREVLSDVDLHAPTKNGRQAAPPTSTAHLNTPVVARNGTAKGPMGGPNGVAPTSPEIPPLESNVVAPAPTDQSAALPTMPLPGVPPFPSAGILGTATIPGPPGLEVLEPDHSDPRRTGLARAKRLAELYRTIVSRRFGAPCKALLFGNISTNKFFGTLVDASVAFIDRGIPPAAWIAWRCDLAIRKARERGETPKPPPLTLVFSAKEISKPRGWHDDIAPQYIGRRVVRVDSAMKLYARYEHMREVISREGVEFDRERCAEIVKRYFPDGHAQEYQRVQDEIRARQRELDAQVRDGEFFW